MHVASPLGVPIHSGMGVPVVGSVVSAIAVTSIRVIVANLLLCITCTIIININININYYINSTCINIINIVHVLTTVSHRCTRRTRPYPYMYCRLTVMMKLIPAPTGMTSFAAAALCLARAATAAPSCGSPPALLNASTPNVLILGPSRTRFLWAVLCPKSAMSRRRLDLDGLWGERRRHRLRLRPQRRQDAGRALPRILCAHRRSFFLPIVAASEEESGAVGERRLQAARRRTCHCPARRRLRIQRWVKRQWCQLHRQLAWGEEGESPTRSPESPTTHNLLQSEP